ncbi:MAG: GNAT family N-acetyltransferase [Chloroflexi bacterium]|nr:GNAT family N-acetyltransferase [Chloroflexota bacterium]
MNFPRLKTERLFLRELRLTDQEAMYDIFRDKTVTEFYNINTFTSIEDSLALLERRISRFHKGRGITWAITRKSDDAFLGCCGYNAWFKQRMIGEIGYELGKPFWNDGYMTEALRAIVIFGFKVIKLQQVEAWVMPGNDASVRVLEKLGFESKGVRENKGYWNGRFHNLTHFVRTKKETQSQ